MFRNRFLLICLVTSPLFVSSANVVRADSLGCDSVLISNFSSSNSSRSIAENIFKSLSEHTFNEAKTDSTIASSINAQASYMGFGGGFDITRFEQLSDFQKFLSDHSSSQAQQSSSQEAQSAIASNLSPEIAEKWLDCKRTAALSHNGGIAVLGTKTPSGKQVSVTATWIPPAGYTTDVVVQYTLGKNRPTFSDVIPINGRLPFTLDRDPSKDFILTMAIVRKKDHHATGYSDTILIPADPTTHYEWVYDPTPVANVFVVRGDCQVPISEEPDSMTCAADNLNREIFLDKDPTTEAKPNTIPTAGQSVRLDGTGSLAFVSGAVSCGNDRAIERKSAVGWVCKLVNAR